MTTRLLFLLAFFTCATYGQQGNIWYFGSNAGLDFNSGSPVVLTDGQLVAWEGVASIADGNGDLLFYTNGIIVWNKEHGIMPNGADLMGNDSSAQSGVIVPKPMSPDIYYIFTVDAQGAPNGFRYSEVDLTLQGGLGDVTANKNIPLQVPTTEQITAVLHQNGTDIWVLTHELGTNKFYAYLVTSAGVSAAPVTSNTGAAIDLWNTGDAIGYMKASPDGTRIGMANQAAGVQLFDFDNATGEVSNGITISTVQMQYGLEFSESGNVLYTSNEGTSEIYQYDLLAADIGASALLVLTGQSSGGALQLAPNGKIYQTMVSSPYLNAINNPNEVGMGCDPELQAVDLSPAMGNFGLPSFIQSYFIAGGIVAENFCLGDNTNFSIDSTAEIESVEWDFGDGETSDELEPVHIYDSEGTYHVTATIVQDGEEQIVEKDITIVLPPDANTPANMALCDDESANLEEVFDLASRNAEILGAQPAGGHTITYHASETDADANENPLGNSYINTESPQTIYARITSASGCYNITSFTIEVQPYVPLDMPGELVICGPETLTAPAGFDSYLWSTGETTASIEVTTAGLYSVTATNVYGDLECDSYAEVEVINAHAGTADNMILCDPDNNGNEIFDLAGQTAAILDGQAAADFTVTYHASAAHADANTGILPANYANTSSPQTIYARLTSNDSGCYVVTTFTIEIITGLELNIPDISLCPGDVKTLTAPDGFDTYLWSTGETTPSIDVDAPGLYTLSVSKTVSGVLCENYTEVTVAAPETPVIETLEINEWTQENNSITVVMANTGDFVYSLDNVHFQESPVFTGLESGIYTVYVQSIHGNECGIDTREAVVFSYPKFFTPNGDSINETWRIALGYRDPGMMVYVFDRFGKLISSFRGADAGWDGTFNGNDLPATDYWFMITRKNGEEFKGHFSLIR